MVVVTLVVAACGDVDETRGTKAATTKPDAGTASPGTAATGPSSSAPVKAGTGIDVRLTLTESFAEIGGSVDFEAQFVAASPSDSSTFTKSTKGIATLTVELPNALKGAGQPTLVRGSVAASGEGSGVAQVGVEVARGGRSQVTRLTIFVEADLGYVAVGDANESTTRRLLADGLLRAGVIDQAEHDERIAAISGGTG